MLHREKKKKKDCKSKVNNLSPNTKKYEYNINESTHKNTQHE